MECYTNGMTIYNMANKFDRSQNAIRMQLDRIKPRQNYTYTPSYTPSYTTPQIEHMPIQTEKSSTELDGQFILNMRAKGMCDEDIKKSMFTNASYVSTPKKNDTCFIA